MTGVHWVDVVVLVALWGLTALVLLVGAWVRRWWRDAGAELDAAWEDVQRVTAVEVAQHPSQRGLGRWGGGPVPVEDRSDWGAR